MKMPDREYEVLKQVVSNWRGTKEDLQAVYDKIAWTYEDGPEKLRSLDKLQIKWRMDLH